VFHFGLDSSNPSGYLVLPRHDEICHHYSLTYHDNRIYHVQNILLKRKGQLQCQVMSQLDVGSKDDAIIIPL
jgi:hypothetical protein